ncbi:unnamed protein product [Discula destructiva]
MKTTTTKNTQQPAADLPFLSKYESGFAVVNPDKVPALPDSPNDSVVKKPTPIALPGDSFYLTDALHAALPKPPAPPSDEPAPPPPPPPPPAPPYSAVMIETDPASMLNLVPLILDFANHLGPTWPITLVTVRANWIEPHSQAFRRLMQAQQVRIAFLPEPYATTGFPTHAAVSVFLTQPWLWEQPFAADAHRVLLFQADSVLCGNSASRVDDFAAWDLVGAPIAPEYGAGVNGGLSLRNPRAMLAAIRGAADVGAGFEDGWRRHQEEMVRVREAEGEEAERAADRAWPSYEKFEDQWFWWRLNEMNKGAASGEGEGGETYKLPSVEEARRFAVETVWEERPLGYHQPFRWLSETQRQKAMEWCPELIMLKGESHFF